ncbi:hypothetical protein CMT56_15715 [Elizabethkingia anophelis]|uniref:TOMM precursor leader peptide-binding protein n=1 Tax=Elizabethkingia anophelis TaxID=1117645 RepID=UPI000995979C|nr:TOMM precursor leader peptide-binding protein [Elizabethkingia anophelis]AQW95516.1 hypothetical protein BBD30_15695 [Elizabethkingia anophelis]MDV3566849.1 hypothetical protein [Elizabethkingia anophelis]MDV3854345.1 hypothetical protein [Elizabethkingia anophelis]MDV3862716.1 hypothetical protein [Elizabethkingia anophelis]MDV3908587.1 hypothetical protein [Elizabethkingia anophelis]
MINQYDIFKDETLGCYQIRTKSNSYMVEFDDEESEQLFLSIVELINRDEKISYSSLKKSLKGDESKILDILSLLKEYGLLPDAISSEIDGGVSFDKLKLSENKKPISETSVVILGDGYLSTKIVELLMIENFSKVSRFQLNSKLNYDNLVLDNDIIIVDSTHWSPSDLENINTLALKYHKPWLHVGGIDGFSLKVGPLFYGDRTGCYNCLISRILSNHEYPEFLISYGSYLKENKKSSKKDIIPDEEIHLNILANYVVLEVKKFFIEWALPMTWRAVVKIELGDFSISRHKLLKKPFCEICNPQLDYNPSPWLEAITLK